MPTTNTAFLGVAHIHTPDFVARLHARDDVKVVAVFDHDAARAGATQREFSGARLATSAEEILADSSIQSVIVCSETVHHLALVVAAAKAGKHIFCEKPLGLGAADAQAIAAAVKTAGVLFQTGFFFRGQPAHQFVLRELRAGTLGTPTRARYGHNHMGALERWFDRWAWFTQPELSGGGALLDLGAHCMDLIVQLFGSSIQTRVRRGRRPSTRLTRPYPASIRAVLGCDWRSNAVRPTNSRRRRCHGQHADGTLVPIRGTRSARYLGNPAAPILDSNRNHSFFIAFWDLRGAKIHLDLARDPRPARIVDWHRRQTSD